MFDCTKIPLSDRKKNKKKITDYLSNYKVNFSRSLDDIYEEVDIDRNGFLEMAEAVEFMEKANDAVQKDRRLKYKD